MSFNIPCFLFFCFFFSFIQSQNHKGKCWNKQVKGKKNKKWGIIITIPKGDTMAFFHVIKGKLEVQKASEWQWHCYSYKVAPAYRKPVRVNIEYRPQKYNTCFFLEAIRQAWLNIGFLSLYLYVIGPGQLL